MVMMCVVFYEKEIPGKGLGVFANEFIPKGTKVWKLTTAKKYSREEYEKLHPEIKKEAYPEGDHFVQAIGEGESWNHSCDANTWWTADDELSALRDIQQDEEITYDYATTDIDPDIRYSWKCHCGGKNCRKILHWNDILIPEVYKKYQGHLPSWVEEFVKKEGLK
jgi:SET domain-containing protein